MSIVDPIACGFAKVIVSSVITETHSLVKNEDEPHTKYLNHIYVRQHDKTTRILGEIFFHVEYKSKFIQKITGKKNLVATLFDLNKRRSKTKNKLLATYRMTEITIQCLTAKGVSRAKT